VPRITIPEKYRDGVAKIRDLSTEQVREVREMLDSVVATKGTETSPSQQSAAVSTAIEAGRIPRGLPIADAKEVAIATVSMYAVKQRRDVPNEQFVHYVADALAELGRLPDEERDSFTSKLIVLLGSKVFDVTSKVDDLRRENERSFCHARIITDLRPVFTADVNDGPSAMVVVHQLKLAFHCDKDEDHPSIFISLSGENLNELRKIIDRAEAKANTLKNVVSTKLFGIRESE
jgi:hypothetical protein